MIKRGFDPREDFAEYYPDPRGYVNIEIDEMERIAINIGARYILPEEDETSPVMWVGCQLVGDKIRPLPIGSTLDARSGVFYWIPGPGFTRQYQLVFFERGESGDYNRRDITVVVRTRR